MASELCARVELGCVCAQAASLAFSWARTRSARSSTQRARRGALRRRHNKRLKFSLAGRAASARSFCICAQTAKAASRANKQTQTRPAPLKVSQPSFFELTCESLRRELRSWRSALSWSKFVCLFASGGAETRSLARANERRAPSEAQSRRAPPKLISAARQFGRRLLLWPPLSASSCDAPQLEQR